MKCLHISGKQVGVFVLLVMAMVWATAYFGVKWLFGVFDQ